MERGKKEGKETLQFQNFHVGHVWGGFQEWATGKFSVVSE